MIQPLFVLSGTLFPIGQLPGAFQIVAKITPTWHGAELFRSLSRGDATIGDIGGHVGYLVLFAIIGTALGLRNYRERLRT